MSASSSSSAIPTTSAPQLLSSGNSGGLLRTAVRLLSAIERLSTLVPSIGSIVVPQALNDRERDQDEEEDEDESSAHQTTGGLSGDPSRSQKMANRLFTLLHNKCLDALLAPSLLIAGGRSIPLMVAKAKLGSYGTYLTDDQREVYKAWWSPEEWNQRRQQAVEQAEHQASIMEPELEKLLLLKFQLPSSSSSIVAASAASSSSAAASSSLYSGHLAKVPLSVLEELWRSAPVSPFGDVASQQTIVDTNVRMARELSAAAGDFTLNPDLSTHLAQLWSKHMLPRRVRVEPYKLNIYGVGGHFAPHRDTPAAGLVGTILVGLADTADQQSGLRVWSQSKSIDGGASDVVSLPADAHGTSVIWRSRPGSIAQSSDATAAGGGVEAAWREGFALRSTKS